MVKKIKGRGGGEIKSDPCIFSKSICFYFHQMNIEILWREGQLICNLIVFEIEGFPLLSDPLYTMILIFSPRRSILIMERRIGEKEKKSPSTRVAKRELKLINKEKILFLFLSLSLSFSRVSRG